MLYRTENQFFTTFSNFKHGYIKKFYWSSHIFHCSSHFFISQDWQVFAESVTVSFAPVARFLGQHCGFIMSFFSILLHGQWRKGKEPKADIKWQCTWALLWHEVWFVWNRKWQDYKLNYNKMKFWSNLNYDGKFVSKIGLCLHFWPAVRFYEYDNGPFD